MSFKQRLLTLVLLLLYQILHLIASFWLLTTVFSGSKSRARMLHLGFDQMGSCVLGWGEDETMSSHMGRYGKPVWMKNLTNWIFFHLDGQVNHCENEVEDRYKIK